MKKLEYFWNIIFYFLWQWQRACDLKILIFFAYIFSFLPDFLKTKSIKNPQIAIDYWLRKNGPSHYYAANNLTLLAVLNSSLFTWIMWGILQRFFGQVALNFYIGLIPPLIAWLISDRLVFHKNKYLYYFAKFKKRSNYWYKKWKWITILLIIESVAVVVLGIYIFLLIINI